MSSGAGAAASGAASTSSEAMAPCKNASRLNSFFLLRERPRRRFLAQVIVLRRVGHEGMAHARR